MEVFIIGLHIVLCFFLILVVLLQPGKGADFGAAMGGSSQEAFGATGSVTILTKITGVVAAMFMMTSLGLAWYSNTDGAGTELSPEELEKAAGAQSEPGEEAAPEAGEEAAPEAGEEAAPEAGEEAASEAGEASPDGEVPPGEEASPDGDEAPKSEGESDPTEVPAD
jgi:preprotein translocase subunit SecG